MAGCRRSCAGVARGVTSRRPTRRDPAGSTLPSSSADAMTTRRGTTSSATATRPTPPSSTTAAAPRTPTLPDAPPTSTAPTTTRSAFVSHLTLPINRRYLPCSASLCLCK